METDETTFTTAAPPAPEKPKVVHIHTRQPYLAPTPEEPLEEGAPDDNAVEHLTTTLQLMEEALVEGLVTVVFDREDGAAIVEVCLPPGKPTATSAMMMIGALEVVKERLLDIVAACDGGYADEEEFEDE